ncbi:transcobalamin-1-like [Dendronephthya gigantea]|uniref:transcobalamin-1-like n=1 Tax=Dendronephthya gigantea TaxID=151771 RepID=UPI00106B2063|nr:transcobalamin-1-like [Dendronephthya gigantea]
MKTLLVLSCLIKLASCFCGSHNKSHDRLVVTAVQTSNWLRENYGGDLEKLEPNVASSMVVALRLTGYQPKTITSDFKTKLSHHTIVDYLKSHLDKNRTLKPGHIANIFQAISALCLDPDNFYGHNLTHKLHEGFKLQPARNYFEYSSVALAICQSMETKMQPQLARTIMRRIEKAFDEITGCRRMPDSPAMAVMALSCLRRNVAENRTKLRLNKIISRYTSKILESLRKRKDSFWNTQSKGLLIQAFMSIPEELQPRHWRCNRLMSAILNKHDPENGFGNVLAAIQILPALLGRSLLHLNMMCPLPPDSNEMNSRKVLTVCVTLTSQHPKLQANMTVVVRGKATAYDVLAKAAEKNDMYKFKELKTSYGRMITEISGIKQNSGNNGYYWTLYEKEGFPARDGVDLFRPKNNTCIIFKYESCADESANKGKNENKNTETKEGAFA